jgi:hypothetical protein
MVTTVQTLLDVAMKNLVKMMCTLVNWSVINKILYVPSGVSAISIALGGDSACVIVMGGGVKCWGRNGNGQLGIGSTTELHSPADVPGAVGRLSLCMMLLPERLQPKPQGRKR